MAAPSEGCGNSQAGASVLDRLEHVTKADLSKRPAQVAAMFDEVAEGYDRTNAVLSMGNATLWRVATTKAVAPRRGERILDVAAGTGTSSASLAASGAHVVAADFSPGMIDVGRRRQAHLANVEFVEADATALPFADNEFDAVTISFGLRNVVEPEKALAEFFRVTKPGGRVVICEFSTPPAGFVRWGYGCYQRFVMPAMVKLSSSNDSAYDYLNESIRDWPDQQTLAGWLKRAGFTQVEHRNLTLGVVALHRGVKPLDAVTPAAAQPEAAKEPASANKPAARPTTPVDKAAAATTEKPAAEKPEAEKKSAAAKSAAAKPAAAKKPTAAKPAAAKTSTAAKPAAAKKPAASKPAPSAEASASPDLAAS